MEDSFRVRVDKAFGSLASISAKAAQQPTELCSLWSLTDDEIERNEWNRDSRSPDPEPEPGSFVINKGFLPGKAENSEMGFWSELEKDLDDLDDDDDDGDEGDELASAKPDDYNDEEWEIKNSIGLDSTLDFEEEEDKYDKVAVGKGKSSDRVYMKDICEYYGVDVDSSVNELPNSFKDAARDPRANHVAAKLRLKEDDASAVKKMDSLEVSERNLNAAVDDQMKVAKDGNLKSILKRKEDKSDSKLKNNQLSSKSQKRVRFDLDCKDGSGDESDGVGYVDMESDSEDESLVYPLPPDYPSGIPDYMRNPSKYTRYTFDPSADIDDQSNKQAFMDFLKMFKKSNDTDSQPDDASSELPKTLPFVPKRKGGDTEMLDSRIESKQKQDGGNIEALYGKGSISIAAADAEDGEVNAMEEDEPETTADKRNSSQRADRKYRTKAGLEMEDF